jgi:hypothetical protein
MPITKRYALFIGPLVLASALTLTSCSNPLTTLDTIVTAAEAAVPILQAAGVPIPPAVPTYLADVTTCISTNGGTSNPTTGQLALISACLSNLIAPTLTGLPAAIVTIIGQVIADVTNYLNQAPTPAHTAKTPVPLSTTAGQQLNSIAVRAGTVAVKCRTLWPGKK